MPARNSRKGFGIQAPMTCREFADFMSDYLAGELASAAAAVFKHHLSICVNCVRYLTSYRETVALGKRAFDDEDAMVPPQVPNELVRAILAARSHA